MVLSSSSSSEVRHSWVNDNGVPNGPNNACCSCLTLRIGVIIIGLLNSFFDLFLFTGYTITPLSDKEDLNFHSSANVDMSIFTLSLIQLIVNIVLIYGAFNRIPNYTVPWLCINSLIMVILLVLITFLLFFGYVQMSMNKSEYISCLIALGFIGACHLFSCFVVFQFRKNTVEENRIMANIPSADAESHTQRCYSTSPPSAPPTYEEDETDESPPDYDTAMQTSQNNASCTQRLLKKSEPSP
ncbi:unnamed protein product [Lepeophtheirus salmonis]|uniref:(salmon louse) hypothetical protein n=1 Tax=Lepeophtheirus salmonis TaxID=72036 RepID=A0A7R8HB98_LEPSM|nr:unnamed protein product [Lepeophtheirus salmonis]CAF2989136.1 unnamed protein product [Lepeophtheirus salmonis]